MAAPSFWPSLPLPVFETLAFIWVPSLINLSSQSTYPSSKVLAKSPVVILEDSAQIYSKPQSHLPFCSQLPQAMLILPPLGLLESKVAITHWHEIKSVLNLSEEAIDTAGFIHTNFNQTLCCQLSLLSKHSLSCTVMAQPETEPAAGDQAALNTCTRQFHQRFLLFCLFFSSFNSSWKKKGGHHLAWAQSLSHWLIWPCDTFIVPVAIKQERISKGPWRWISKGVSHCLA